MSSNIEVLSELLVARLLEEDLRLRTSTVEAKKPQLEGTNLARSQSIDDSDFALALFVADARLTSDAAYAESLQVLEEASFSAIGASMRYAQTVAVAESKLLLDAKFARKLQDAEDAGKRSEELVDEIQSVLEQDAVPEIISSDSNSTENDKGKNKMSACDVDGGDLLHAGHDQVHGDDHQNVSSAGATPPYIVCGICLEPCQETNSPISASSCANSSSRLIFGLRLPCPGRHTYCINCLSSYIQHKLEPDGPSGKLVDIVVFPIQCPECPILDWANGIEDDVAEKILSKEAMLIWHEQKLRDSILRHYCPNPRCSVLLEMHEETGDPRAVCPNCEILMCVSCRVEWHQSLTCAAFQALPPDERSPEDRMVLQLAKVENWRRCPKCAHIIELTIGCNHMRCVCKAEFCFRCQALWDKKKGRCSREPACEFWDEERLLETRERERDGEQPPQSQGLQAPSAGLQVRQIANNVHQIITGILAHGVVGRNRFTSDMVRGLRCGYCCARLNSVADLRYHLTNVRRHSVFACCSQFFKDREVFDEHKRGQGRLHEGEYMRGG